MSKIIKDIVIKSRMWTQIFLLLHILGNVHLIIQSACQEGRKKGSEEGRKEAKDEGRRRGREGGSEGGRKEGKIGRALL